MKHIQKFESYSKSDEKTFQELMEMNPNSKYNDLYAFLYKDEFVEDDDGKYIKTLGIENMVRITPDKQGMFNIQGLQLRSGFQPHLNYHQIWLPKDIRDEVEGKGYKEIDPFILNAIKDKIKEKKPKQKLVNDLDLFRKDIEDKLNDIEKYNL